MVSNGALHEESTTLEPFYDNGAVHYDTWHGRVRGLRGPFADEAVKLL